MNGGAAIGRAGAARLLVRLQLRRLLNQIASSFGRLRPKAAGKQRTATAGKAKLGWMIGSLVGIAMLFGFTNISYEAVTNMQTVLGSAPIAKSGARASSPATQPGKSQQVRRVPLPPAPGHAFAPGVLQAIALECLLLLTAALLMSLGSGELARPDWDLEWLVTLPVSLGTLLAVRILERTIVSPLGLMVLWPFFSVVAWEAGYRAGAIPLALLAALPLLTIAATVRTLIDTGLRLSVSPARLRNLNALISISAAVLLYLAMSVGMSTGSYVLAWAPAMPAWTFWLAPGLATSALTGSEPSSVGLSLLALALQAGLCAAVGVAVLIRQLRLGVVATGTRESGGRGAAVRADAGAGKDRERRMLLSPIQARELRLLARDRNFLIQTLVLPVVLVGTQILFNAGESSIFASAPQNPEHLAAIAFVVAAYALMFSAFQTLNNEGHALWILYSVPHPLESILRQKAILWGTACLIYPVAIFAFAIAWAEAPLLQLAGLAVVVILGVPIFAVIATALGVFACDPLAQEVQRRIRASYLYLYMLLASTYVYGVYISSIWQRAGLITLTALLGLALWQKARDHLPYLLDPSASPPARVSLSDGLIAAVMFFVVQGLVAIVLTLAGQREIGRVVLIAFVVAGAVTFAIMRLAFWRLKSEGVPSTFGPGVTRAVATGIAGGAAAALMAFAYLTLAAHTPLLQDARESVLAGREHVVVLAVLAVLAAPVFEEFIFRGLIFGGLRRSLGLTASTLASAAIFALVHPPAAVIPVFGLGVAAALVYDRTRLLIGPIAVHAVYNAAVVAFPFLF